MPGSHQRTSLLPFYSLNLLCKEQTLKLAFFGCSDVLCVIWRIDFCVFQRPGVPGAPLPGRAILSMNGLSFGVIRVNTEDKNSALTVQDVGHVMPGGKNTWESLPRMSENALERVGKRITLFDWS